MRSRSWRALFSAGVVSSFGDELTRVALPAQIYAAGGGVAQLAWLNILQTLPFAVSSWAGRIADRGWNRMLLIGADVARAAALLFVILSPHWQLVVILAAVMQFGTAFFAPAETSLEARLLEGSSIVKANSWRVMSRSITRVLGPVAAGVLIAWRGTTPAFVVDALTFVASAALIGSFVVAPPAAALEVAAPGEGEGGDRAIETAVLRSLRPLLVFQVLMCAVFGFQGPLIYDFAAHQLATHKEAFGLLMGALAVGTLIGAFVLERLLPRGQFRQRLLGSLVAVDATLLMFFALSRTLIVALTCMTMMGGLVAAYQIMLRSAIQQTPLPSMRGRVAGLFHTVSTPAMIASLLLAAPLQRWSGSTPRALLRAAALEVLAALVLLLARTAPRAFVASTTVRSAEA